MEVSSVVLFLSGVVTAVLLVVCLVHFRYHWRKSLPGRLTSWFLFAVFYATFVPLLIQSGLVAHVPHLYRTGTFGGLMAPPLMYLITVSSLTGRRLKWIDLLHLLPCIFYLVNFSPFFCLGAAEKVAIIQGQSVLSALYSYSEGWLIGGNVMGDIRILQIVVYLALTIRMVVLEKQATDQWKDESFNWKPVILQLIFFITLYLLPTLVGFGSWFGLSASDTYQISFTTANLVLVLIFIMNPELLYGMKVVGAPEVALENPEGMVAELPEQPGYLVENTTEEATECANRRIKRIKTHLKETHSYLNPEFSLNFLERELGISAKLISRAVKDATGLSFTAFVNDLRIAYVLDKFMEDPQWRNYTVETIAGMVGYRSPTSFYSHFRDKTGKTPREFIETLD